MPCPASSGTLAQHRFALLSLIIDYVVGIDPRSPEGSLSHSPWAVWAGPNVRHYSKSYCSVAGTVAAAQYFPVSPIPETEREADQVK